MSDDLKYLESMIQASGDTLNNELTLAEGNLQEMPNLRLEYAEVHDEITARAIEMITTVAKKYHNLESDYIKDKIELDSVLFASSIFQLRTSEFAIKTIIEDINAGNNTSSVFGSLDRMQRVNSEIVKNMQEQIIIIEQKYKVLQSMSGTEDVGDDSNYEAPDGGLTGIINDGGYISLGTKKLLQHLTGLDGSAEERINRQFVEVPTEALKNKENEDPAESK